MNNPKQPSHSGQLGPTNPPLPTHQRRLESLRCRTLSLQLIGYMVFTTSLAMSMGLSATQSQALNQQQRTSTAEPVTNESVEDGLRKVRETLRTSAEFHTHDAPTHLRLAKRLSQQGDPNGAIEEYQATLRLDPLSVEAYRGLGAVFIDKHEWRNAERALQNGTALNPYDHQAWYWLGRAFIAQEHFQQAQEALITATQLDHSNPEVHSDLGLALMAQGSIQKAETALKHAITLQPDFAEAHDRLERVQAAHGKPQALIYATQQILQTLFRRE